ncbi:NSMF factor, partial [Polypterus senegalus]
MLLFLLLCLSDHLLAETFIGQDSESPDKLHRKSPLQQPLHQGHPARSPQQLQPNKRRLSLISNGKFDRSSSEEPSEDKDSIPAQVYTISRENGMLGERESSECLELRVLKGSQELVQHATHHGHGHHHGHHHSHHHTHTQPLQSAGSTHNIGRQCRVGWAKPTTQVSVQQSFDLDHLQPRENVRGRKKLERMYSVDRVSGGDLQMSCDTLDEEFSPDWEAEREQEVACCEGDDFIPPKVMLISSKVPKAEYVPTIIRRDDSSIIPILYDHEHATFDDILDEIEKKLNVYRKGCKIWKMLIFCQGGPGHLYLLKNKVATFAKVEKEEDLIQFWKRLSRLMSKINPEPNVIHIMGCYILGNPNGEKVTIHWGATTSSKKPSQFGRQDRAAMVGWVEVKGGVKRCQST